MLARKGSVSWDAVVVYKRILVLSEILVLSIRNFPLQSAKVNMDIVESLGVIKRYFYFELSKFCEDLKECYLYLHNRRCAT